MSPSSSIRDHLRDGFSPPRKKPRELLLSDRDGRGHQKPRELLLEERDVRSHHSGVLRLGFCFVKRFRNRCQGNLFVPGNYDDLPAPTLFLVSLFVNNIHIGSILANTSIKYTVKLLLNLKMGYISNIYYINKFQAVDPPTFHQPTDRPLIPHGTTSRVTAANLSTDHKKIQGPCQEDHLSRETPGNPFRESQGTTARRSIYRLRTQTDRGHLYEVATGRGADHPIRSNSIRNAKRYKFEGQCLNFNFKCNQFYRTEITRIGIL